MPSIQPSPELAYVIGSLLGDGYVYKTKATKKHGHGYVLRLRVKDEDFADAVNDAICKVKDRSVRYIIKKCQDPKTAYGKGSHFELLAYSKEIFEVITNFESVKKVVLKHPADFIRGFADAEGGVYHAKRQTKNWPERWIHISNTEFEILQFIASLLKKLQIKSRIYEADSRHGWKKLYHLVIRDNVSIVRFYELIGFKIKRKMAKLEKACQSIRVFRREPPSKSELENLAKQGFSTSQIGEIYNISQPTASLWLRNIGIHRGRRWGRRRWQPS